MNFVTNIIAFNERVLKLVNLPIAPLEHNVIGISVQSLKEEIEELKDAAKQGDFVQCLDAIGDLIYFSVGILHKLGMNDRSIIGLLSDRHYSAVNDPFLNVYGWCATQSNELAIPLPKNLEISILDIEACIDNFYKYAFDKYLINTADEVALIIRLAIGLFGDFGVCANKANQILQAIHDANMEKKLGVNAKRGDGKTADAIKPLGWIAPEKRIELILESV